ncbi:MAG: hypothetical protein ACKO2N_02255, partial [Tabrizicola sp.]
MTDMLAMRRWRWEGGIAAAQVSRISVNAGLLLWYLRSSDCRNAERFQPDFAGLLRTGQRKCWKINLVRDSVR